MTVPDPLEPAYRAAFEAAREVDGRALQLPEETWVAAVRAVAPIIATWTLEQEAKETRELKQQRDDWREQAELSGQTVLAMEREIARLNTEIERLKREGTPGVMHKVDEAFYQLALKERDVSTMLLGQLRQQVAGLHKQLIDAVESRVPAPVKEPEPVKDQSGPWRVTYFDGTREVEVPALDEIDARRLAMILSKAHGSVAVFNQRLGFVADYFNGREEHNK